MLNKVMLIGNVGAVPEVRYLENQTQNGVTPKVATFRMATSERFRDRAGEVRERTEWHNIVAWRQLADLCEKFVGKGTQIYVEGRLTTRSWDDQSGAKHYQTEIVADTIQLLGRRGDNASGVAPAPEAPASAYGAPARPAYAAAPAASSQPAYAGSAPQQPAYAAPAPGAQARPAYASSALGGQAPAAPAQSAYAASAPSAPAAQPQPAFAATPAPAPAPAAVDFASAEPDDDLPF